ncbi:MAG: hypothetical protein JO362_07395 [Streptomycetaceae bacterium]|nr:hypothetical protein [Streptomycetaceae bacterium]
MNSNRTLADPWRKWYPLDNLPNGVVPYLAYALDRITKGEIYSEYGWETA